MDAEIRIMSCQGFSEKKILSLLSDQLRQMFDYLYWARIMGRDQFGSSTVEENATIMRSKLQSQDIS